MTEAATWPCASTTIAKAFGATVALDGASFAVRAGEVHALLGENGAGKSTMVKLLSGLVQPDSGTHPARRRRRSACAARPTRIAHGIQTAFQEMTLVRDLTVAREHAAAPRADRLHRPAARRACGERRGRARISTRLGLDGSTRARRSATSTCRQRQKIEIARAVYRRPRILLLDEPTSTLAGRDIDWLGELIAGRSAATASRSCSSRTACREVRAFCDRLTVLRNGRHIGTGRGRRDRRRRGDPDDHRPLARRRPSRRGRPSALAADAVPVLAARGLATDGKLADAGFELRPGEILGVAGLQGMGQQDLFLACFGMTALRQGEIRVDGRQVTLASPRDAVRANIGISLVPEDRKTEGLFLGSTASATSRCR